MKIRKLPAKKFYSIGPRDENTLKTFSSFADKKVFEICIRSNFPKLVSNFTFYSDERCNHRYRKAKIDCLSFVMCPLLAQPIIAFFSSFFAVAIYSTNEANKAGSMRR